MSEKFVLPISRLSDSVSRARAYSQTRGIIPALANVYFIGDRLLTFNGKAGFGTTSGLKAEGEGFGLLANQLSGLLATLPLDGDLQAEVDTDKVVVSCGSFKGQMKRLEMSSFPRLPTPKKKQAWPEGVWEAVRKLYFSVSQDETKPSLRGVHITAGSKGVYPAAYSSDSYRISRVSLGDGFRASLTLPDILLAPIVSHGTPPKQYSLDENTLWLFFEEFDIHGVLLAEVFPGVEPWFVKTREALKKNTTQVIFDNAKAVQDIVDRLLLFSTDVLYRVVLTLDPKKQVLNFSMEGESGSAAEPLAVKHTAKVPVEVHCNGKFFAEAVGNALVCHLPNTTDGTPLYFLDKEEGFEHLLLPLSQQ